MYLGVRQIQIDKKRNFSRFGTNNLQNNEFTHSESNDRRSFSLNMTEEIIMLEIQKTLVSLDLIEKKFVCDLNVCKGACCVIGDSGAPITNEEQNILESCIQ